MKKMFFSVVGALLMCVCLFWFTDILSDTLSYGTILLAIFVSVVWNGFFVKVLILQGTFYKSRLYPAAVYHVFFLLFAGIIFIAVSDKPYRVDAWDGVGPYVTLTLVSMVHGLVLLLIVKWNEALV